MTGLLNSRVLMLLAVTTCVLVTVDADGEQPARNYTVKCWECLNEDPESCNLLKTLTDCASIDLVCFWKVDNIRGSLVMSKGCQPREDCRSLEQQNDAWCNYGGVTDSCNWCCEDDECNDRIDYSPTTQETLPPATTKTVPATKPTTRPPATKPTTRPPATKPTTARPPTKPTTRPPATKPTTRPPATKPTTARPPTKPTTPPPATKPTTARPPTKPTTRPPATKPTTRPPATKPTSSPATTTVATVPTAPPSQCDLLIYVKCVTEIEQLLFTAFVTPGQLLPEFCSNLPEWSRCMIIIRGCIDCGTAVDLVNSTLLAPLNNMMSLCSSTCDETAAVACLNTYYQKVSVAIVMGNVDCVVLSRLQIEQRKCYAIAISTCDLSVRVKFESMFTSIDRQVLAVCSTPPSTTTNPPVITGKPTGSPPVITGSRPGTTPTRPVATTTTTTTARPVEPESPLCNRSLAIQCITSFAVEVIKYQSGSQPDLGIICKKLEWSKQCYLQASVKCFPSTQDQLTATWNASASIVAQQCIEYERPKCDTTKARSCVLELWKVVDEAKDFETACRMINATLTCVAYWTASCSSDEQISMNSSLQIVINMIGGRCNNIIEILPGSNSTIDICEGDDWAVIIFRLTSPPSSICGSDPNCRVFVDIDIEVGNNPRYPRCRNGKVIPQAALMIDSAVASTMTSPDDAFSREVTDANWSQNQTVNISARSDFLYDGSQTRTLTLTLRKDVGGQTVERRTVAYFVVVICDRDRPATCSIVNDPHITTFDGRYYNNFQEGFFVAYSHRVLPYEVQIATQKCNEQASCNCAAGVRSGDTVFFIDSCRKKSFVERFCRGNKYNCANLMKVSLYAHTQITPGTRIISRNDGKEFLIYFPHGTAVKIIVSGNYLNLWITASPADWKSSYGLCGYFDGRPENDLMMRDKTVFAGQGGVQGQQPIGFNNDWRVPDAAIIAGGVAEDAFTPPYYCVRESSKMNVTRCGYDVIQETCDQDVSGQLVTYDSTYNDAVAVINIPSGHKRHRRDTSTTAMNDYDIDPKAVPEASNSSEWNTSTAEAYCKQYFNNVTVASSCMKQNVAPTGTSLQSCIDDLVVTGQTSWMATALEALKENCVQEIGRNPTLKDSAAAADILSIACPNQCSQRGNCVNGTCVCQAPYIGNDCSFNPMTPIELVLPVNNGLCDTRASNCYIAQMLGAGFVPAVTTCVIQPVQIVGTSVTVTGESNNIGPAIFISPSEVHCSLNTASSAYVQLTNAPSNSSNSPVTPASPLFIVYDSVCFTCYAASNVSGPSCVQLSTSCVIDGICYGPGEQNPRNSCQVCQPTKSTSMFSFSDACTTVTPAPTSDMWSPLGLIVGLTVGLSALVAIVIGLISWICIKHYHTKSMNIHQSASHHQSSSESYRPHGAPPQYGDYTYTNESFKPVA